MVALDVLIGTLQRSIEENGSVPLTTGSLLELVEYAVDTANEIENDKSYAWMEE